jgi:hypothetical protein
MSISVWLEPKAGGFRASTNSPFALSCEGTSESMDAFRNASMGNCGAGLRS